MKTILGTGHSKRKCALLSYSSPTASLGVGASANDSTIIPQARETFKVSTVIESLSTGLYLIAFGLGSLVAGPFFRISWQNASIFDNICDIDALYLGISSCSRHSDSASFPILCRFGRLHGHYNLWRVGRGYLGSQRTHARFYNGFLRQLLLCLYLTHCWRFYRREHISELEVDRMDRSVRRWRCDHSKPFTRI